MELKPNITNIGNQTIKLSWGRFRYELKPGEIKFVPQNVLDAMITRYPGEAVPFNHEGERVIEEANEIEVDETVQVKVEVSDKVIEPPVKPVAVEGTEKKVEIEEIKEKAKEKSKGKNK